MPRKKGVVDLRFKKNLFKQIAHRKIEIFA